MTEPQDLAAREHEAFEKWASEDVTTQCLRTDRRDDGEYASIVMRMTWLAWNARAALAEAQPAARETKFNPCEGSTATEDQMRAVILLRDIEKATTQAERLEVLRAACAQPAAKGEAVCANPSKGAHYYYERREPRSRGCAWIIRCENAGDVTYVAETNSQDRAAQIVEALRECASPPSPEPTKGDAVAYMVENGNNRVMLHFTKEGAQSYADQFNTGRGRSSLDFYTVRPLTYSTPESARDEAALARYAATLPPSRCEKCGVTSPWSPPPSGIHDGCGGRVVSVDVSKPARDETGVDEDGCVRCGKAYTLRPGHEPTPECDACAHALLAEVRAALAPEKRGSQT